MKKKLVTLLTMISVAALLATGCGTKQEDVPATEPETTEEEAAVEETTEAEEEEPAAEETEQEAPQSATYEDPNGWSLQYYEDKFEVNQQDNVVSFVYTGESAGTNMLTVTYDVSSKDPETIVDGLIKEWGDGAVKSEGTFPTDETVPVVRASLPPAEDGSGLYMEAIVRSFMDGCLVFELTGHNSGDDELDMAVSDNMAMLINSVVFSNSGDNEVASLDITGCDTFTQIVDKLEDGRGYANVKIGSEDALLVSSGTYDNGDGNMAAIDAEIFVYLDGAPVSAGIVTCGGTAYPLAVKDDKLFVSSGHAIRKYVLSGPDLMTMEGATEDFDTDGNATYSYFSDDEGDYSDMAQEECQKYFEDLFAEYAEATVVNFDTVGGAAE
ncbi:MAG: hypothetical protein K6E84_09150 [Lachnospiraceae bacterium]|nr:hypothetical protein [Lachnospiraceae bacterium]